MLMKVQIDNPNVANHLYALERSMGSAIRRNVNQEITPVVTSPIISKPREAKFTWFMSVPFRATNVRDQRARRVGIPLPQNAQAVLRLHRIVLSPCQRRTARHFESFVTAIVSASSAVQQSFGPAFFGHGT